MRPLPSSLLPLLLATRSAGLQDAAAKLLQIEENSTLPRDGRAVIVLRGKAFRCKKEDPTLEKKHQDRASCCDAAIPAQEEATASLLSHVIQPLEARGNKVEIVVTDGVCNHTAGRIVGKLEEHPGDRVIRFKQRDDGGEYPQCSNIRFALDTFKAAVPGGSDQIVKLYDLVLLLRHDTFWRLPIDRWQEADFRKFNFASRCEEKAFESCVNDVFQTMPGRLFPSFDGEVGRGECFFVSEASERKCQGWRKCLWNAGHFCAPQIIARLGAARVGYVTQWRPTKRVRDGNWIWGTYNV